MERFFGGSALAITGGLICALTLLPALLLHPAGQAGIALTPAWIAIGFVLPLYVLADGLQVHHRAAFLGIARNALAWAFVALYFVTVAALLWASHRKYAIILALAETIIAYQLMPKNTRSASWMLGIFVAALASWALTLGFTYTHVADFLVNATGSSGLAIPTFFLSFAIALYLAVSREEQATHEKPSLPIVQFAIAFGIFFVLGFRTDNQLTAWIPYHQNYFVAPASLVQAHHWLLWDIPSQYGFLSILTIAAMPGRTTYDSLYLLTALILLAQACIVYLVLRSRRSGWLNFILSVLLCAACFYSSQGAHYPLGPRLYPQEGLRFVWPLMVLFAAFCRYRYATSARLQTWFLSLGYAGWIFGVLWSFETGVWTTVIWFGYLLAESAANWLESRDIARSLLLLLSRFGISAALLAAAIGVIELIYRAHFGHGPDWLGYFEFSAIYTSSLQFAVAVDGIGGGWTILLVLAAVATLTLVSLRQQHYRLVPLLAACWCAMWATSSYYVGEAFNEHVNMLSGIIVLVGAIVFWATEKNLTGGLTALLIRLSFIPVFVLLIASAFGGPSRIADIRSPFLGNYTSNFSSGLPPISGELRRLEDAAGFKPADAAIYPNSPVWVKLSSGVLLPLERGPQGTIQQRSAWLPLSPLGNYNAWLTLPFPRRIAYIERYLDDSANPQGWYITYREPADCRELSPRLITVKHAKTENYEAAYCRLIPGSRWLMEPDRGTAPIGLPVELPGGRRIPLQPISQGNT